MRRCTSCGRLTEDLAASVGAGPHDDGQLMCPHCRELARLENDATEGVIKWPTVDGWIKMNLLIDEVSSLGGNAEGWRDQNDPPDGWPNGA